MFKKIKNFLFGVKASSLSSSIDDALKGFTKVIENLQTVMDEADGSISKNNIKISELQTENSACEAAKNRAASMKEKLGKLFE